MPAPAVRAGTAVRGQGAGDAAGMGAQGSQHIQPATGGL